MRFFTFFIVLVCVSSSVQPWSLFRRKQAPKKEEVAAPEVVVTETEEELLVQQAKYKALYDRILGSFLIAGHSGHAQVQYAKDLSKSLLLIPLFIFLSSAAVATYISYRNGQIRQPILPRPSFKNMKLPQIAKTHPYISGVFALGSSLYGARALKRFIRRHKKARMHTEAAQVHDIFANSNAISAATIALTNILVEWPTLKKEFPDEVLPLLDSLYKRFSLDGRLPVRKDLRPGIVSLLIFAVMRNFMVVNGKLAILRAQKKSQNNEKGTTEKVVRVSRPMGDFFE
jgi:hypothetical protein